MQLNFFIADSNFTADKQFKARQFRINTALFSPWTASQDKNAQVLTASLRYAGKIVNLVCGFSTSICLGRQILLRKPAHRKLAERYRKWRGGYFSQDSFDMHLSISQDKKTTRTP